MAIRATLTEQERAGESFEQKLARLRATPQERAQRLASLEPFDYDAWSREAGPPAPEELAEMEEFLRDCEVERQRSLAQDEARGERFVK